MKVHEPSFLENRIRNSLPGESPVSQPVRVCYILSDIDKALAFEWIAERMDPQLVSLSYILIVQQKAALEEYLKKKKIACTVFYYDSKKDLPGVLWKVYRYLKTQKPVVIHCHLLYGSLIGLTAGKLAGIRKRIYTRHHSDYHHRYFPKGIKWDKWCNGLATHIVAPSMAVQEVLEQYEGVPVEKISIVHHGFDIEYFTKVPEERVGLLQEKYRTDGYYPVVGVIARFTELKGIQYIIPAFKRLLSSFPQALLMLFNARGDYEKELLALLTDVPEDNYRLIPFEQDLSAVYKLFHIFIQVSTDKNIEAFGQTYVEALASGVPSVFTLAGIAQDFVKNGDNALVVPFKDSNSIYESIERLLHDPGLYQRLAVNGYQSVADRFSLERMIQLLEKLYTK